MVNGRQKKLDARLRTHNIYSIEERCLEFYYFMFGSDVGRLTVYWQSPLFYIRTWQVKGNQGNRWHRGFVRLRPGFYYVFFEASEMGYGTKNAIALDDITVQKCEISGE